MGRACTWDLERRIRRAWESASPHELEQGARWYEEAYKIALALAIHYSRPMLQVAGLIAAISPGNRWEQNLVDARKLLDWDQGGRIGEPPTAATYSKRNVEKGISFLDGAPVLWARGPKVKAFYRLILTAGAGQEVCVDSHCMNLAFGRRGQIRGMAYKESDRVRTEQAYRKLAAKLRVWPSTLQAVTWLVQKRRVA